MSKENNTKKGFSHETIVKTIKALKGAIAYFIEKLNRGEKIKVTISKGNQKIGNTWNLSTAPVITCGNCKECMHFCYAIRDIFKFGYDFLKNCVLRSRAKNTAILLHDRNDFFGQIDKFCSGNRKVKVFRWHVSGEIIDKDYFDRMVTIARNHSEWIFWTYTKMHSIVNEWITENGTLPENFNVMFSEWLDDKIDNPHGMPTFHTVTEIPENATNVCGGNCQYCIANKIGCPYGMSMLCKLH